MTDFRSFLIWILLMLAEMGHAILRNIFLVPALGDFKARQLSVFTGSIIIFIITLISIRWINAVKASNFLWIGISWVILTVIFECALGKFVFQYTWQRIFSEYDVLHGGLMPIGLLAMALSPFAAAKIKRII